MIKYTGTLARSYGGQVHHLCCEAPSGEPVTVCGKPLGSMAVWPIALNARVPITKACKRCLAAQALDQLND